MNTTKDISPIMKTPELKQMPAGGSMRRLVQRLRMLLARWVCYHMGCEGGWYEPCTRCGEPVNPNY